MKWKGWVVWGHGGGTGVRAACPPALWPAGSPITSAGNLFQAPSPRSGKHEQQNQKGGDILVGSAPAGPNLRLRVRSVWP